MSELEDLYQEMILDHNRRPRNFGKMDKPDYTAEGYNPLCGDRVTVYLKVDGDRVTDATFEGSGCAISTASASLMTESVKGKTLEEAKALFAKFHGMVTGERPEADADPENNLGKLEVFCGVCKYPARVKCATLVWHTVNAAIDKRADQATTE